MSDSFFFQLRTVELDLEEAKTELAKKSSEAISLLEERKVLQNKVQEKERAMEQVLSDFEKVRSELQKKEQLLLDNDKELSEVRLQLSENEKEKEKHRESAESEAANKYQLQEKKYQKRIANLQSKVDATKSMRDEHLEEVAAYRETIRQLEGDLEDVRNQVSPKPPKKCINSRLHNPDWLSQLTTVSLLLF